MYTRPVNLAFFSKFWSPRTRYGHQCHAPTTVPYNGKTRFRCISSPIKHTRLRFAPASALLIQFLPRVQSQSHSENDLMGSFSNPLGAIMVGFDNCCRVKRLRGVHACVAIKSTISDHIIPLTLLSFTERAALVKGHVSCIGSLRGLRSISFVTCTSQIDSESTRGIHTDNISCTVLYRIVHTFVGNSCTLSVIGLGQTCIVRDRATAVQGPRILG